VNKTCEQVREEKKTKEMKINKTVTEKRKKETNRRKNIKSEKKLSIHIL